VSLEPLPEPANVYEAIKRLADDVGELAYGVYQMIGETSSFRVQHDCNVIGNWAARLEREARSGDTTS
jgi:hypothetical protein